MDKTERLWWLKVEDLLQGAGRTGSRNLSTNEWQAAIAGQTYFEVFPGLPIPKQ